ncbi:MAG: cache domain-containing protein [Nitrososphaeraceae archaeon]
MKSQFSNSQNQSTNYKDNTSKLLSVVVENKIEEAVDLLLITSQNNEVKNTYFSDLINNDDMGIPENVDMNKRDIAKMILNLDKDFGSVYFTMSNADIYMGEPFSDQKQLKRLNYADREWYNGISSEDNKTYYVSGIFISASIHKPAISIAVPVHNNEKNKIIGYWVGILNLHDLTDNINNLYLNKNDYISIFDQNGTIIADSRKGLFSQNKTQINQFNDLDSVREVLDGKKGIKIENVNNFSKLFIYHPINTGSHYWGITYTSTNKLS